ncbi:MAG: TonB-dependent receptor [Acidobacteria bacterium]|nr:TonB-dependent receptor [Acidobacteriota bacterium]
MYRQGLWLSVLVCLLLTGSVAIAQVTTGTISGTVTDATGAIVPGAEVTVKNVDTGITRVMTTDERGRYTAPQLPPGNYEVSTSITGFQTEVRRGISLTLGREAMVNFALQVGSVTERVEVTAEAPLVDTTQATVGGLVEEVQMRSLPVNLRSFEQLAGLEPGVIMASEGSGPRGGMGTRLNISGARAEFNSFQIDNVDVADVYRKTPGGVAGGVMGIESIKEFRVERSNYSAEFGLAAGGVINVITRSGTNQFHGSLYLFNRNDTVASRNFFDRLNDRDKPEFRRNQFGGAIGGPIRRDKTFFFANYEGLRQARPTNATSQVPTALARQGILPSGPVAVNPRVEPYLKLYPLPNGPDHGNGTADYVRKEDRDTENEYVLARVDHQLSANYSLTGRFIFEEGESRDGALLEEQTGITESKKRQLSIQQQSILSPRLINEFRFGFTRTTGNQFDKITLPESLNFIPLPGRVLGDLSVSTMSNIGHSSSQPIFIGGDTYMFLNNMTFSRGAHNLKWGVDVRKMHMDGSLPSALHGRFRFNSLGDFLRANLRDSRILLPGGGRDEDNHFRQWLAGFFFQDDYQVRPNLTVNLGLRYEFITVPTETSGKIAGWPDINSPKPVIGPPFENPSLKNFAPRVGFAWDPFSTGKTSVRGGFGIFYDQIVSSYFHNTLFRMIPFYVRLDIRDNQLSFPDDYQKRFAGVNLDTFDVFQLGDTLETSFLDFDAKNPYMMQYNIELQHEILPATVLTTSYVGSRGVHLATTTQINTPVPQQRADGRWFYVRNAPRRVANIGPMESHPFDANSFYNSLQLSLRRRFLRGFQFQGSYTWSHSIDDASGQITGADNFAGGMARRIWLDRTSDRGNSGFDVRQNFTFNSVWELPFGQGMTGAAKYLLGGWQVNGILRISSGLAGNIEMSADTAGGIDVDYMRPDLAPGASSNPINPGNHAQYIRADAFVIPERGLIGNLGRNTFTLPGNKTFDFSLFKTIPLGESRQFEFRAEFFNLFNITNFGSPDRTFATGSASSPRVSPTFGRILTTSAARQIQFGLKFSF